MPRGGTQSLSSFETALALPPGFCERTPDTGGEGYRATTEWLTTHRPADQNHWPALSLALISQIEQLLDSLGLSALEDGLDDDRICIESGNMTDRRAVYTLNVTPAGGGPVARLRPNYNRALAVIRTEMRRQHPSNPGHATQSWPHYRVLINMLFAMTPGERAAVAQWVWSHGVLGRPEVTRIQHSSRQVRPFYEVISRLSTASRYGGALFQAMAYGYVVADSPTLRVESNAVNTGSSRAGAIGDVDGYDGEFLVLAVEAKDRDLTQDDEDELTSFIDDADALPDADAVIFARSFDTGLRDLLVKHGIRAVSRQDMIATVSVWDPTKQIVALKAMRYFLVRIQKNPQLLEPLDNFVASLDLK